MKLLEKILIERITNPEQLSSAEQERVKADPALEAAIRENLSLARLKSASSGAPDREAVLTSALDRRTDGGNTMSLIERLFFGKRWYLSLGAALLLLAAVTLLALLPHTKSWAKTDGYVLSFDYGQVGTGDASGSDDVDSVVTVNLATLNKAVKEWLDAHHDGGGENKESCRAMLNVNVDNGHLTAVVALLDASRDELEDLAAWLKDVPGVPEPTITDATWFHPDGKLDPSAGLSFSIMDHQFTFPVDATESDIEQTINGWLAENKPDFKGKVDVTITTAPCPDGGESRKIMIKILQDDTDGDEG